MSDLPEPRIADVDRDRVSQQLRVAYGEGRITEGELEDRLVAVYESQTASELSVVVADLPPAPLAGPAPVARPQLSFDVQAAGSFLMPAVICTLIYLMTMPGGYFWPMWVWLGCGIPVAIALFDRADEDEQASPT